MVPTAMLNALDALGIDINALDGPRPAIPNKLFLAPAGITPGVLAPKPEGTPMDTITVNVKATKMGKKAVMALVERIILGDVVAAATAVTILRDAPETLKGKHVELLRLAVKSALTSEPEEATRYSAPAPTRVRLSPAAVAFTERAAKLAGEGDRMNRKLRARKLAQQSPDFEGWADLSKKEIKALVRLPIRAQMTVEGLLTDMPAAKG